MSQPAIVHEDTNKLLGRKRARNETPTSANVGESKKKRKLVDPVEDGTYTQPKVKKS